MREEIKVRRREIREDGGYDADFIRFSSKYFADNVAVCGRALPVCTNNFRSLPAASIECHWDNGSNISAT
jgi:hypothetical protein